MMLLSVFLAAVVWLFFESSQDYQVFLEYEVRIHTDVSGRAREALSQDVLLVRGSTGGFRIISHRLWKKPVLDLSVPSRMVKMRNADEDQFVVSCDDVRTELIEAFSGDMNVEFFVTDSLKFSLPVVSSRKVPVVANSTLAFAPQYMALGNLALVPDSIEVFGPESRISSINQISTKAVSRRNIRKSLNGIVPVNQEKGLNYSETRVYYSLEVTRFVEQSFVVPVHATDVPWGKELKVIPSEVTLTVRHRLEQKQRLNDSDFILSVSYEDFYKSLGGRLVPVVEAMPNDVYSVSMDPPYVDCVLLDYTFEQ
ncbi:MAG: hypothetical protein HUJ89_03485 [Bacteroidales bacterium]|nr:hypothetical protein [Bacteroidales bacterium]